MLEANIYIQVIAFLCPHNHPKINSLTREENRRTQRDEEDRCIVHGCHLNFSQSIEK